MTRPVRNWLYRLGSVLCFTVAVIAIFAVIPPMCGLWFLFPGIHSRWYLLIALLPLIAVPLGVTFAYLGSLPEEKLKRLRKCQTCGYDLRGHDVDSKCPECGHLS